MTKSIKFAMKTAHDYALFFVILSVLLLPVRLWSQENQISNYDPDTLISAAREIMAEARYCALITVDASGHPQARTMDPFAPEDGMVVWFGTNLNSRKVKESTSGITLRRPAFTRMVSAPTRPGTTPLRPTRFGRGRNPLRPTRISPGVPDESWSRTCRRLQKAKVFPPD